MDRPDIRNEESVRAFLEHFEDEIIMHIISRAQIPLNKDVYSPGHENGCRSRLDAMLNDLELAYAKHGRYQDPIERPFNRGISKPYAERKFRYPEVHLGDFEQINVTRHILQKYLTFVPTICLDKEEEFGSTVEHDAALLMTISQRVHSGVYVAECKYQKSPNRYERMIKIGDRILLLEEITNTQVEDKVKQRVRRKTASMQEGASSEIRAIVSPDAVSNFYQNCIIPLTKEVQILYLLNRNPYLI